MLNSSRKSIFAALVTIWAMLPVIAPAQGGSINDVERIKAAASTYHASGKTTVLVELADGRSYKGRITEVGDDHFVLFVPDANREVQIRFDSVATLRKKGMSKAAKTAIWVGVGAGIGALIIFGGTRGKIGPICPLGCGL